MDLMIDKNFKLHEQLQVDCIELLDLPLCKLLLCNDSTYPWFILVPRVSNTQDIYQLDWQQQQQFLNESSMLSELLITEYNGDKMNVAALGNVVSQLHIHHIVRFKNDVSWPKPIWGQQALVPYVEDEIQELKANLIPQITSILMS